MADSGVPFALDAASAVLVEDLSDIPAGLATTVDVLMTDLLAGDEPSSMTLTMKEHPDDSNINPSTIIVTITQTVTADGAILPTADPTIWRGLFQLTADQVDQIATATTYTYTAVAVVVRPDVGTYDRMVQRGGMRSVNDA